MEQRYFDWMIPHKWMTGYTQQTEWIEKRGILVWLAEVFTSLGSGLYLIALLLYNFYGVAELKPIFLIGLLVGWVLIMFFKIPMHLAYFGKPFRFWRTIPPFSSAWKTSWFARGILFSILFTSFGFIQIVISGLLVYGIIPPSLVPLEILFMVLGGLFAFLTGIYPGFIMNFVKGIQFWNNALLPVVLIIGGILDGCALLMAIPFFMTRTPAMENLVHFIEVLSIILIVVNVFFIGVYLLSATYVGAAAKVSVSRLMRGNAAGMFWIGLVGLAIIIPLVLSIVSVSYVQSLGASNLLSILLIIGIASHTLGAFALKYCILKVGIYKPLFPVNV